MTTLDILYRDDDLVVVNKPSGLLVHRGWDDDPVVAMTLARDAVGAYVYPVHRLDRGTSGALVFALTREAASRLHASFEEGRAVKRYLALVRGIPADEGVIDSPVPSREDGPRVPALTHFRRLASCGRFSLVEALPRTGRLHQVRRHLKHLGHPLVGDVNYGRGEINREFRDRWGLRRLALHAASLTLEHPTKGAAVRVDAPMPPDLREPLLAMGFAAELLAATADPLSA